MTKFNGCREYAEEHDPFHRNDSIIPIRFGILASYSLTNPGSTITPNSGAQPATKLLLPRAVFVPTNKKKSKGSPLSFSARIASSISPPSTITHISANPPDPGEEARTEGNRQRLLESAVWPT